MSRVWSCNEWDQLEEVIVGNPFRARYPTPDKSTQLAMFPKRSIESLPRGDFPERIIEETAEDLSLFIEVLQQQGVVVQRPHVWDHQAIFSTIHWKAQGYHNFCPRDIMTVIADRIIESPSVVRSRMFETFSYRDLLIEYMQSGAKWYSAPKPMLQDSLFDVDSESKPIPRNHEPAFDAANVLRLGYDLLYLVSVSGNELGGQWLQTILGDAFRVHFVHDIYYGSHIDTTFAVLRPGLVLCNPDRVNENNMPIVLRQWDTIYSPPVVTSSSYEPEYFKNSIASEWIGMNVFSISPNLVVVDKDQLPLIHLLEKWKMDVIPLKLRHSRLLGGGFHCATLDVRRTGTLQRYFQ